MIYKTFESVSMIGLKYLAIVYIMVIVNLLIRNSSLQLQINLEWVWN